MGIKANIDIDQMQEMLGAGGEVKLVPLFVPIQTFQLLLNVGKERGLSVSDVLSKAIELFLLPKCDTPINTEPSKSVRVPNFIMKRRR